MSAASIPSFPIADLHGGVPLEETGASISAHKFCGARRPHYSAPASKSRSNGSGLKRVAAQLTRSTPGRFTFYVAGPSAHSAFRDEHGHLYSIAPLAGGNDTVMRRYRIICRSDERVSRANCQEEARVGLPLRANRLDKVRRV